MSFDLHNVSVFAGQPAWMDRLHVGLLPGQPYPTAGSAGASVEITVAAPGVPANAIVVPVTSADAVASISNKSYAGFTVTIAPRLATETLAAGAVDILVVG